EPCERGERDDDHPLDQPVGVHPAILRRDAGNCEITIAPRIIDAPAMNASVTGSCWKTMEVIDAAIGSNARMTAASVAVTCDWPHISATNASAVVTIAVKRITVITNGVRCGRGTKSDGGIAASPTTITCTAASPSAGVAVLYFAESTMCSAKQTAQVMVRMSPKPARASMPPISKVVPAAASTQPSHARAAMRRANSRRSQNGTITTYKPVRNADRDGEIDISPRVCSQ